MHRNRLWLLSCLALACGLTTTPVLAQDALTLKQVFESAWTRQPEAQAGDLRRDAADAARSAAAGWLPAPPALEASAQSDRFGSNDGSREYEVGVALPMWLPGERGRSIGLAEAEWQALDSRTRAAKWRLAADVRESWWAWQRARSELALANDRLESAKSLAEDVSRRARAGDLARADQHQADGAAAQAESDAAQAQGAEIAAWQVLRVLAGGRERAATGGRPYGDVPVIAQEPLPSAFLSPEQDVGSEPADHPALAELQDQATSARRTADLASRQTRERPELMLAATSSRDQAGESFQQTFTFGVRLPLGSTPRHRANVAQAQADAVEAEAKAELMREQVSAEVEAARGHWAAAQIQLQAAEKRARLARESKAFFEKSFRLGESDLPTRLRIELDALEAERQAARARIDAAAAVSALRQALGLLPE